MDSMKRCRQIYKPERGLALDCKTPQLPDSKLRQFMVNKAKLKEAEQEFTATGRPLRAPASLDTAADRPPIPPVGSNAKSSGKSKTARGGELTGAKIKKGKKGKKGRKTLVFDLSDEEEAVEVLTDDEPAIKKPRQYDRNPVVLVTSASPAKTHCPNVAASAPAPACAAPASVTVAMMADVSSAVTHNTLAPVQLAPLAEHRAAPSPIASLTPGGMMMTSSQFHSMMYDNIVQQERLRAQSRQIEELQARERAREEERAKQLFLQSMSNFCNPSSF